MTLLTVKLITYKAYVLMDVRCHTETLVLLHVQYLILFISEEEEPFHYWGNRKKRCDILTIISILIPALSYFLIHLCKAVAVCCVKNTKNSGNQRCRSIRLLKNEIKGAFYV